MKKAKTSRPVIQTGPDAAAVEAQIVCNPLTGIPVRASTTRFRPEYCDLVVKLFAEMLEESGRKLADSESEETRTKASTPKKAEKDADGKRPRIGGPVITERRTVKRKEWTLVMAELPSFSKFGRQIGVSKATISGWQNQFPSFGEACAICTGMLEDAVSDRALNGQYDATFSIFVLKNWCGMKDRHEITGADGAPLNPPAELRGVPMAELDVAHSMLMEIKNRLLLAGAGNGENQR